MTPLEEIINARCIEVGECWEWQGAMQSCGTTPVVRIKQKTTSVRRLLLEHAGVEVVGKFCTYKCGNPRCVNPAHLEAVSRKRLSKRVAQQTQYGSNMLRRSRIAEAARRRAKLNPELVEQIRAAEGSQRKIAKQFGISQATVSNIKRGNIWRDYSNPFSQLLKGRR